MTMFIQIVDGNPVGHPVVEDNLRALFPGRVFPVIYTPEYVEPLGFGMFEFTQVPEAPRFKKAVEVTPVKRDNGIYYQSWEIVDMTVEEQAEATEKQAQRVRAERDFKLLRCDWTQIADSPLQPEAKAAWATYRQALRDVTAQAGFPWDVQWPEAPN